jgi:hypothetical protein
VLDEFDRELERRGHRFVRYADDSNIYVRNERAGQRVMESITQFITQELKLKVNEAQSAVARLDILLLVVLETHGLLAAPSRSDLQPPFPAWPICCSAFRLVECLTSLADVMT